MTTALRPPGRGCAGPAGRDRPGRAGARAARSPPAELVDGGDRAGSSGSTRAQRGDHADVRPGPARRPRRPAGRPVHRRAVPAQGPGRSRTPGCASPRAPGSWPATCPATDQELTRPAARCGPGHLRQDEHARVRHAADGRAAAARRRPATRGTSPGPPVGRAAARRRRSRPGWCRSRTATTSAARSGSRRRAAGCSASSPAGPATRSARSTATSAPGSRSSTR